MGWHATATPDAHKAAGSDKPPHLQVQNGVAPGGGYPDAIPLALVNDVNCPPAVDALTAKPGPNGIKKLLVNLHLTISTPLSQRMDAYAARGLLTVIVP